MSARQERVRAVELEVIRVARLWWATRPFPNCNDAYEGLDTAEQDLLRAVVGLIRVQP